MQSAAPLLPLQEPWWHLLKTKTTEFWDSETTIPNHTRSKSIILASYFLSDLMEMLFLLLMGLPVWYVFYCHCPRVFNVFSCAFFLKQQKTNKGTEQGNNFLVCLYLLCLRCNTQETATPPWSAWSTYELFHPVLYNNAIVFNSVATPVWNLFIPLKKKTKQCAFALVLSQESLQTRLCDWPNERVVEVPTSWFYWVASGRVKSTQWSMEDPRKRPVPACAENVEQQEAFFFHCECINTEERQTLL